jgi:hypothetical protein
MIFLLKNNKIDSLTELKTMLTVDIEDLVEFGNKHKFILVLFLI